MGYIIYCKAEKLAYLADAISAVSLEGFDGRIEPFTDLIHLVRPHKGQVNTAARMLSLLEDSEIIAQPKRMFKIRIRLDVYRKYMVLLRIP